MEAWKHGKMMGTNPSTPQPLNPSMSTIREWQLQKAKKLQSLVEAIHAEINTPGNQKYFQLLDQFEYEIQLMQDAEQKRLEQEVS